MTPAAASLWSGDGSEVITLTIYPEFGTRQFLFTKKRRGENLPLPLFHYDLLRCVPRDFTSHVQKHVSFSSHKDEYFNNSLTLKWKWTWDRVHREARETLCVCMLVLCTQMCEERCMLDETFDFLSFLALKHTPKMGNNSMMIRQPFCSHVIFFFL